MILQPIVCTQPLVIVHLIPHMGGGAGKVLKALVGWLADHTNFSQQIFSFEAVQPESFEWASRVDVTIYDAIPPDSAWLHDHVMAADIVHLHFWNHPSVWNFMQSFSGKPARLLAWSYVNGINAFQYIPQAAINFYECFAVSSSYSTHNPHVRYGMGTG